MNGIVEIEAALRRLPRHDQWEIARWLMENLEELAGDNGSAEAPTDSLASKLPDYAAHRRRIFGEKVLPNMVLAAREDERW